MSTEDNYLNVQGLRDENKNLRFAVEELSILNEIAVAISSTLSLDRILNLIIEKCRKHLKVEQAAVLLLDKQKQGIPFQTMIRLADSVTDMLPYRLDTQLAGWMLKNKKPLIINDFAIDERFKKKGKEVFPVHSLACVPLTSKGSMIGIITLFNKKSAEGFSQNDKRLLAIIATQSAQVIENARLLKEEKALLRIQEELRMAYNIQTNLLPREDPAIQGYDIVGKSIPAKEVGGDYFDFITTGDSKLAFCLGDVSGKGMPAALLMANLQATVHGQVIQSTGIKDFLCYCNALMYRNTDPEKFATLFFGILDPKTGGFCYSNAGHNYPLLFSAGKEPVRLESGGVVLGCLESYPFDEEKTGLDPGDLLLIYSDGITEAINDRDEEFDESRLIKLVTSNWHDSSQELTDKIIKAVQSHAKGLEQMDDMTLVLIRREKQ